jgi:hypothetical protein
MPPQQAKISRKHVFLYLPSLKEHIPVFILFFVQNYKSYVVLKLHTPLSTGAKTYQLYHPKVITDREANVCPVWGRCKQNGKQEVVHRAAALRALVPLWWLLGSNVPRKGGVDESRPQDSGLHIVRRLGPRTSLVLLFAGKTWFHLTRPAELVHARQFHVCPYLCSCISTSPRGTLPLLVSKRIARASGLPASQAAPNSKDCYIAAQASGRSESLSRLSPTLPSDPYSRTPPFGNAAIAFILTCCPNVVLTYSGIG